MEEFRRQHDLLRPEDLRDFDTHIVGAGALGGAITLALLKAGFGIHNRVTVTDFDIVKRHNLPTQWARPIDAIQGTSKVEALATMALLLCDRELEPVHARFRGDESGPLGPIVIVAVDSIEERRAIWARLKQRNDVKLLIDARMGAEIVDLYAVDLLTDSRVLYEASLEGEPHVDPCTRRAVVYTVLGAAGFVGSIVRGFVREEPYPRHVAFDFRNFLLVRTRDEGTTRAPRGGSPEGRVRL